MEAENTNADIKVIETLENKVKSLEDQLTAKNLELEGAHAVNAELTNEVERLSSKQQYESAAPVFEKDGITYGFHFHKAQLNGSPITSADVIADEAIQQELIDINSGMIYAK